MPYSKELHAPEKIQSLRREVNRKYKSGRSEEQLQKAREYSRQYAREHRDALKAKRDTAEAKLVAKEYQRRYIATLSEDKQAARLQRQRERQRIYLARDREARNESKRLAYASTSQERERAKKQARQWRKSNPERRRAQQANRRALKRTTGSNVTSAEIDALYARQKGKCAGCSKKVREDWHLDHVEPLIRGGLHCIENLQILCAPCNMRKHTTPAQVWAASLGRLFA